MAKILIVDDEEGIRMLYAMELQDEGYEVITLPDGKDLLEVVDRIEIHVGPPAQRRICYSLYRIRERFQRARAVSTRRPAENPAKSVFTKRSQFFPELSDGAFALGRPAWPSLGYTASAARGIRSLNPRSPRSREKPSRPRFLLQERRRPASRPQLRPLPQSTRRSNAQDQHRRQGGLMYFH